MQDLAWTISLILMAVVAITFLGIARSASSKTADAAGIVTTGYRWRGRAFWGVMASGVAITLVTLGNWPIEGHASNPSKPDVVIQATGHQWRWDLSQDAVDVGQMVEFHVTAADVNHGFAIYRDKTTMVAQTQAMPGIVNRLQVRFTEPGDYEVLCLEYCGLAHHAMRATIKVRPLQTEGRNQ